MIFGNSPSLLNVSTHTNHIKGSLIKRQILFIVSNKQDKINNPDFSLNTQSWAFKCLGFLGLT